MDADDPVLVDVQSPARFQRDQLLARIALGLALAILGVSLGWIIGVLYLVIPVGVAVCVAALGTTRYRDTVMPRVRRAVEWLLGASAYLLLLTDWLPAAGVKPIDVELRMTGSPTIVSALGRLLLSIPSLVVLMVLTVISQLVWLGAAIFVVLGARMPRMFLAYQRGVLRWQAHLLAYHASLVDEYPPFQFDPSEDTSELAA